MSELCRSAHCCGHVRKCPEAKMKIDDPAHPEARFTATVLTMLAQRALVSVPHSAHRAQSGSFHYTWPSSRILNQVIYRNLMATDKPACTHSGCARQANCRPR